MMEDTLFTVILGAAVLFSAVVYPQWFRKLTETARSRYVEKHAKYLAWIREDLGESRSFSDDSLLETIRKAATLRFRVELALFSFLIMSIQTVYPKYAVPLLGSGPPYWQQILLGVTGGLAYAAFMRFCGVMTLRSRIRQLVNATE